MSLSYVVMLLYKLLNTFSSHEDSNSAAGINSPEEARNRSGKLGDVLVGGDNLSGSALLTLLDYKLLQQLPEIRIISAYKPVFGRHLR